MLHADLIRNPHRSFATQNAVEEKVLERAAQKLRLDQLVIQQGRATQQQKGQFCTACNELAPQPLNLLSNAAASKDDLVDMIQHGAEKILNTTESMTVDDDIDNIIERGAARTAELSLRYAELNLDDLNNFKSESATTAWEGEEFGNKRKNIRLMWIEPTKRERKTNYSVDGYYRDALRVGEKKAAAARPPRAPRHLTTCERLHNLFSLLTSNLYRMQCGFPILPA